MPIKALLADITTLDVECIVNAANENLLAGGGVCGAIHRAAGPELEAYCRTLGGCPTGTAVITPGYGLKARHVIHAVGPRWNGGLKDEAELLESCYRAVFTLVAQHGITSVAIPAISTGIYGYPLEPATLIALSKATDHLTAYPSVEAVFACFDPATLDAYTRHL